MPNTLANFFEKLIEDLYLLRIIQIILKHFENKNYNSLYTNLNYYYYFLKWTDIETHPNKISIHLSGQRLTNKVGLPLTFPLNQF